MGPKLENSAQLAPNSDKSCQILIPSLKNSGNSCQEESVPKSSSSPLLTCEKNVKYDHHSPGRDEPQLSNSPKLSRSQRRPFFVQIAEAYQRFVLTFIIVDEFWILSNEDQDILYKAGNILRTLMNQLRTNLKQLSPKLSLPRNSVVPLTFPKQIFHDQIREYLASNALYSEKLSSVLREEESVESESTNSVVKSKISFKSVATKESSKEMEVVNGIHGGSYGQMELSASKVHFPSCAPFY